MKILDVNKIREADRFTIENEPIASIDLMERAGSNCTKWIRKKLKKSQKVFVFVGPGNNGGDGLVIARQLFESGFDIHIVLILITEQFSIDFTINLKRVEHLNNIEKTEVRSVNDLPKIPSGSLIIDAIFGSGLSRKPEGFVADTIRHINNSNAVIVSIDIPSGLFADQISDSKNSAIVMADYTLSLQLPKFSFMFSEAELNIGQLIIIDIGLHPAFLEQVEAKAFIIEKGDCNMLFKPRHKFSHKGVFGHALLIAGSQGKVGAAVLSARASLRSGLGLLSTHIPKNGVNILQTAVPESMLSIDESEECFSNLPKLDNYNAIGIGPGLGTNKQSQNSLKLLIQEFKSPMVIDADALNILSENKTWLSFLPKGSILTPHPKEFERLAGKSSDSFERVKKQIEFATKYQVYVILKGANTSIVTPEGQMFFNSTGNPGMATAGSGDVLTGILLGLLTQHYSPLHASIIGVYLHGLSADIAAKKKGFDSLIASDIIDYLGKAFLKLQE